MSTTFFISDLHLQHTKILTFGRKFANIEEHDQTIIDNWNKTITDDDIVWLLGDVSVGGDLTKETIGRLRSLRGKKKLIGGNHCSSNKIKIYNAIFTDIVGCAEFKGDFILTHIPVHTSQVEERFKANLHGHLHKHVVMMKELNKPHCDGIPDPRYFNCSCEQPMINFTPLAFDVIKNHLKSNRVI